MNGLYRPTFTYACVAAVNETGGIGYRNRVPWKEPCDMRWFHDLTTGMPERARGQGLMNVVIMGHNTFLSLGSRTLPGRINVVISTDSHIYSPELSYVENTAYFVQSENFLGALDWCERNRDWFHRVFVIGGQHVYQEAMAYPHCNKLYLTRVPNRQKCDRFYPVIPRCFEKKSEEHMDGTHCLLCVYQRTTY